MLPWNQQSDRAFTILQNVSVCASVLHWKLVCSHLDLYKNQKKKKNVYNKRYISNLLILGLWFDPKSFVLEIFLSKHPLFCYETLVAYTLNKENRGFSAWPIEYVKIKIHFAMLPWNQQSDRESSILQNVSVDASALHQKLVFSHHDLYNREK